MSNHMTSAVYPSFCRSAFNCFKAPYLREETTKFSIQMLREISSAVSALRSALRIFCKRRSFLALAASINPCKQSFGSCRLRIKKQRPRKWSPSKACTTICSRMWFGNIWRSRRSCLLGMTSLVWMDGTFEALYRKYRDSIFCHVGIPPPARLSNPASSRTQESCSPLVDTFDYCFLFPFCDARQ